MTPTDSQILRSILIQNCQVLHHLRAIGGALRIIYRKEYEMARTMQEVLDDVAQERTLEESLVTLTGNLKKQLDQILGGTNVPPAVQAQIDAAFDAIEANKAEVAAAVTANTPDETGSVVAQAEPVTAATGAVTGTTSEKSDEQQPDPGPAAPDAGAAVKGNQL